jgi:hypothetical protein
MAHPSVLYEIKVDLAGSPQRRTRQVMFGAQSWRDIGGGTAQPK